MSKNSEVTTVVLTNNEDLLLDKESFKQKALAALVEFYSELEKATGDNITTLQIITTITDGIKADPETARNMLTPENIANTMTLKRKIDNGTFTPDDIENLFPQVQKLPFWGTLKMMMPNKKKR